MLLVWVGIILSGEKKNFQHTKHIVDIVFFCSNYPPEKDDEKTEKY